MTVDRLISLNRRQGNSKIISTLITVYDPRDRILQTCCPSRPEEFKYRLPEVQHRQYQTIRAFLRNTDLNHLCTVPSTTPQEFTVLYHIQDRNHRLHHLLEAQ